MAQRRKNKTNGSTVIKNGNGPTVTNGTAIPTAVTVPQTYISRQDSRLSVKSLIESIENTSKQTKSGSQSGSTTSLNSLSAMEREQGEMGKTGSTTEQEKQQKTLNNNSITSNNNLNTGVNGGQKRGRSHEGGRGN